MLLSYEMWSEFLMCFILRRSQVLWLYIVGDEWIWSIGGNDTDMWKPKYWELTLSHCHFIHLKFHMDWLAIEPQPPDQWHGVFEKLNSCVQT